VNIAQRVKKIKMLHAQRDNVQYLLHLNVLELAADGYLPNGEPIQHPELISVFKKALKKVKRKR
jgi:hypothetical protein